MKKISVLVGLLFGSLAHANLVNKSDATVINLTNNQTVVVPLSSIDPNRLFVAHDKITEANCLAGFCGARFDQSGSVYLTLGEAAKHSSGFSVFVTTENDKHFTIVGMPTPTVSKTIEFTVTGGSSLKATTFEKNTPYQEMLVSLIRAMINDQKGEALPHGLSASDIPIGKNLQPNAKGILIHPIKLFTGGLFQGLVYLVKNNTTNTVNLTTQQFYQHSMVAGALSHTQLKPTEQGYFYGVIQSSEADNA
jgi:conjugal transfer pilus assembly protein TraK